MLLSPKGNKDHSLPKQMTDSKRYQLLELMTEGWEQVDPDANNMTKEQCDQKLKDYIGNGVYPQRLKVVRVA